MKEAAGGGPFTGFGFQYPTSVLQECIYSSPACHDCFRWDWDSRCAWKQPRHKTGFSLTPGLSCVTIKICFRGGGEMIQDPSVPRPQRPGLSGVWRPYFSAHAPCRPMPANSVRPLTVSGRVWYTKAVSRPRKGLLFFCFMVPKWCPTLQNHAVTGYAALFAGFEKMPISCGFAPSSHETICRLMTADLAIQAIKNSRIALVAWDAHIPQPPHKYSFLALCVPILVGLKCCLTLF